MAQAQEIIVYRNPFEKAVWDAVSSTSGDTPWIFMAAASIIIAMIVMVIIEKIFPSWPRRLGRFSASWKNQGNYQLTGGVIVALITFYLLAHNIGVV